MISYYIKKKIMTCIYYHRGNSNVYCSFLDASTKGYDIKTIISIKNSHHQ